MSDHSSKTGVSSATGPVEKQKLCANCQNQIAKDSAACPMCGMACAPERSNQRRWHGISFPMFVLMLTIFCALIIVWAPR